MMLRFLFVFVFIAPIVQTASNDCPNLLWSDEFDGSSLNSTNWSFQPGDGCDLGICGWGNNELQLYMNDDENLQVSGGILKIIARNDNGLYTSARIRTIGKVDIDMSNPTRVEARVKVPLNSFGLWPAFWMLPTNTPLDQWPIGGEIDILEFIGRESMTTHGALHYGEAWDFRGSQTAEKEFHRDVGDEFHVFAIEKNPYEIAWFVDDEPFLHVTEEDIEVPFIWPFESTFHIILNLAVGGHWPGYPNDSTLFPNSLEVDYVRVYQCTDGALLETPLTPRAYTAAGSSCSEHSACAHLEGSCCPTTDNVMLACCDSGEGPTDVNGNDWVLCENHPVCQSLGLEGNCCPNLGVYLDCCEAPPSCQAHPECSHLAGDCCPTTDNVMLDCCS